jgi:hypothetical protein
MRKNYLPAVLKTICITFARQNINWEADIRQSSLLPEFPHFDPLIHIAPGRKMLP